MEPIKATCGACGRRLLLSEIPRLGTGSCPTCGVTLAPGYTHLLLDEARRVEVLQRDLVACLRRLSALPGNLVLDRDPVYEAIAAEISPAQQHTTDTALVSAASRDLRQTLRQWPRLRHGERAGLAPRFVARLHALAQRVRLLGVMHGGADTPVLRQAAQDVDEAAEAIRSEKLHAEMQTAAALDSVEDVARQGDVVARP